MAQPALAVSDAEFAALKKQMSMFASQLEQLEGKQNKLKIENEALKAENSKLQAQNEKLAEAIPAIEELEEFAQNIEIKEAQHIAAIEPSAGDGIKIPGTDTTLKFGGYVKADAITDIGSGYGNYFARFAGIPLGGCAADDKSSSFSMHARQTRLNVKSTTPTSLGDVNVFAEVDFYGTRGSDLVTNGHSPQLRQAYGEFNGLLAGQTWSNFMDLGAYPESLDFVGPVGITLLRQTQVRYSDKLNDGWSYSVSLENPNSDFTETTADTVTGDERIPDFVAAVTKKGDWGHVSLRGLAREISVQNETDNNSDRDFAYGVAASGKFNVGEKDNLKLRATYGDGLGRYLYDVATSAGSAGYNNDQLELQDVYSGYASYQHHWSDTFRSNFMAGYAHINNATDLIGTGQNEDIMSAHANLIWQPVKPVKIGVEYIHGQRELDNGSDGKLNRVKASFIYAFN